MQQLDYFRHDDVAEFLLPSYKRRMHPYIPVYDVNEIRHVQSVIAVIISHAR